MFNQNRFGRIPEAKARSGLSRSKLYELAATHPGLFLKLDAATIVNLEMLDDILAALPPAQIGKNMPTIVAPKEAVAAQQEKESA
jgi:hypothetical protein